MDGIEKSSPLAEGMIEAENTSEGTKIEDEHFCLNCNTKLTDVYCAHCGQKNIPKRQTLGELLINFISSFWSYESKFFKSVRYLIFSPGFLAIEYTEGRRERYFHPARMYVFISFVYFLLFSALPSKNEVNIETASPDNVSYDNFETAFELDSVEYKTFAQYDSVQLTLPHGERDGSFIRFVKKRGIELNNKYSGNGDGFRQAFSEFFVASFPKIFFILLPAFAVILKLLYVRRDFFYSEHLVFSISYYNFFFLVGSFFMIFDSVSWLSWLSTVIGFWIAAYLLIAMKRMYRQSWRKTVLKYVLFFFIFSFNVGIVLLANLLLTLLYI